MPIPHALLIVAIGFACWAESAFATSLPTAVLFFVMGAGVILVGAIEFFDRLFQRSLDADESQGH